MKYVSLIAVTLAATLAGASCVSSQESDSPAIASAELRAVREADAAFRAWLGEQCPDGMAVLRMDLSSGEQRVIPCEDVRAKITEDEEVRRQLFQAYERSPQMRVPAPGDEPVDEARQSMTPVGVACSLIATGLGLFFNWPNLLGGSKHGCKTPGARDRDACEAVTGGGSFFLGVACWFL